MSDDPLSIARTDDRHSHIGIRLQYRCDERWEYLEALEWNAVGFNFYHAQPVQGPVMELRRGLTRFSGTIAWQSLNTSADVVLATVVNRLLYAQAKAVVNNTPLHMRLLKLLRVPGMVTEKLKVLHSLGATPSEARMAELVAHRQQEHPMYHYGVRVQSEAWRALVDNALNVSSVLVSLDKLSGALGKT